MPVGDIYQLSIDYTIYGDNATNVHYFRQDSVDPVAPVGDSLISAFIANAQTELSNVLSDDAHIVSYRAVRVHPNPSQQTSTSLDVPGTRLGAAHTANVGALSGFYGSSAPGFRIKQNRNFIPGLQKSSIVGGLLTAAIKIVLGIFLDKLLLTMNDAGTGTDWRKIVWDAGTATVDDITKAVSRPASRKVRSRTKGVGS